MSGLRVMSYPGTWLLFGLSVWLELHGFHEATFLHCILASMTMRLFAGGHQPMLPHWASLLATAILLGLCHNYLWPLWLQFIMGNQEIVSFADGKWEFGYLPKIQVRSKQWIKIHCKYTLLKSIQLNLLPITLLIPWLMLEWFRYNKHCEAQMVKSDASFCPYCRSQ